MKDNQMESNFNKLGNPCVASLKKRRKDKMRSLYFTAQIILLTLLINSCAGTKSVDIPVPEIITKEQWGGKEHFAEMPEHTISKITIHHGGVEVSADKEPMEYMRNLQKYSMEEKAWMDIPYHFQS